VSRREREALDLDIADELESHLAHAADDLARTGLSLEAARLEARRRFGDLSTVHAAVRREDLWDRHLMQHLTFGLVALLLVGTAFLALHLSHAQTREARELAMVHAELAALRATPTDLERFGIAPRPNPDWTYSVGDAIRLTDSLDPHRFADHLSMTVEPDGKALFPDVGWVMVAGRKRADVEEQLQARYEQYYTDAEPRILLVQD
jgi:hypothetical protein